MMNPEELHRRNSEPSEQRQHHEQYHAPEGNKQIDTIMSIPDFLKEQLGRLVTIEFLIGNDRVTKMGLIENVGRNHVLLRTVNTDSLVYAELNSIKFITAYMPYNGIPNFQGFSNNMTMGISKYY